MVTLYRFLMLCLGCLWGANVIACAICAPADTQATVSFRIHTADRIVLASSSIASDRLNPERAIRGALPDGLLAVTNPGAFDAPPVEGPGRLSVLLFNAGSQTWTVAGTLARTRVEWLLELAGMALPAQAGDAVAWKRAAWFVSGLEDAEPLIAQASFEEVASLPYAALRVLAKPLDPGRLAQWTQDVRLRTRWPLYYLLLGLTGRDSDAESLKVAILRLDPARTVAEESAMLAALLELQGDTARIWLENRYLLDSRVPEAEVQAALLALRVQAGEGGRLSQESVVQSFGRFIQANPQRAGFVASDLGNWSRWEFAKAYADLLQSGQEQVFSSRYAMMLYLLRNPLPQAKALLQHLRDAKVL